MGCFMNYNLSVIIPVFNAECTIDNVVSLLINELSKIDSIILNEIVLVNDNSKDNTLEVLQRLSSSNKYIKVLNFSKNYGQHNALMAGFNNVTGDYVLCMDDDLQTHPSEVHKIFNHLIENDYDVVYANYQNKKHNGFRNIVSIINQKVEKWLINSPDGINSSSFFICRKFVIAEIVKYRNPYPYISGLIYRVTSNVGCCNVIHFERFSGTSNYNLKKLIKLWLNGFTNFSIKPLRVATLTGIVFSFLSFLLGIIILIQKIVIPSVQLGWTSMMLMVIFFGGIQLMSIGLLGEYIGRIYLSINETPQYVIRDTFEYSAKE